MRAGYLRGVRVLSVRLSVSVMPTVHNLHYARCRYVEHSRYLSVAFAFYPMQMPDIWRASLLRKIVEIQQLFALLEFGIGFPGELLAPHITEQP